jgi:glutathione S-transferase
VILIGQYDSPFVRRVAIALRLYRQDYEHRPWSTFGNADRIAVVNPLRRVPTLVLDDGEVLIESGAILDYLDELAGPSKALIAESGPPAAHAQGLRTGDRFGGQGGQSVLRAHASPANVVGLD